MSTIAAGASATLTVTDGATVTLSSGPNDSARLTIATGPNAGAVVVSQHAGRKRYGPFGVGTLTLQSVSGYCTYYVSTDGADDAERAVTAVTLDSTDLTGLNTAGKPIAKGVFLKDPTTKLIYGQSDGAGSYAAFGSVAGNAEDIGIADAGSYYAGTEVEGALQEIGANLAANLATSGNLPQFGAIRAVTDWNKYSVTATALVISGPCIVKGFRCLTGSSIVGVYDALTATGTNLMPSVTTAANTEYLLAGEGGVLFSTGLYVDWGSGTYVFYALPVEA